MKVKLGYGEWPIGVSILRAVRAVYRENCIYIVPTLERSSLYTHFK